MGSKLITIVPRDGPTVLELIGPFFLGILANYFLWGIQITQSYYYYKSYRKTDRTIFKIAVVLLFICDGIQSVCATETAWSFMVANWGNLTGVELVPDWGIFMMPLTDTLTASLVHMFYAHKIWVLLSAPYNYICTAIILSFSCLQLSAGIGCTSFQFSVQMTVAEFNRIRTWVSIWLVGASVTDILITTVMTWRLSKIRTGFRRTDDVISKLIRLIIETGLATAIVQIVDVVIYLIWPLKPYHGVPTFMAPKVYSNSMLAVLNSREPKTTEGLWESTQGGQNKLAVSVESETTQTDSTANNYQLHDRIQTGNKMSSSQADQIFNLAQSGPKETA